MEDMTIKSLLEIYNKKTDKPIKEWKQSKDKLIKKIEGLGKVKRRNQENTLQHYAEELILQVDTNNAGLPYKIILEKIQNKFPDCSTSLNSLRWYAANLNKNKTLTMPIRPRLKKVSTKEEHNG